MSNNERNEEKKREVEVEIETDNTVKEIELDTPHPNSNDVNLRNAALDDGGNKEFKEIRAKDDF